MMQKMLSAKTPTKCKKMVMHLGSRFTEFFHHPYYNTIQYAIIDPLHNLYLGTAKRLHHHWIEIGLLRVDNFNTPTSFGHIPRNTQSGFSNMTADEWKNWTIVYSVIALHDILPPEHVACWQLFVSACRTLCSPVITFDEIDLVQQLLHEFFLSLENLGSHYVAISTHLHLHTGYLASRGIMAF